MKRQDGTITDQELALLEKWYNHYADTAKAYNNPERYLSDMQEMEAVLMRQTTTEPIFLWPRMVAAAMVILLIGAGLYFYEIKNPHDNLQRIEKYTNDIAPGKIGATLTLANGKKIHLADAANGTLAKEAGISINKTASGQIEYEIKEAALNDKSIHTLTTAKGETYTLVLPDKSKVWMNAASSLTYTAGLMSQGFRKIKLEGEAYFEISKDKKHPFIVESNGEQVEVLGTHFNVNAYPDENAIRTTLLEGSVKLTLTDRKNASPNGSAILEPGQQAVSMNNNIKINEVNTSLVTAWKNNKFIFDRLNIQEIMRMISRWYNVEIVYEGPAPTDTFWGSVPRFENVSEVLNTLKKTGNVQFRIEGQRIFVLR